MRTLRPLFCLGALALLLSSCRSTSKTAVKDFDTAANPNFSLPIDVKAEFCPAATKFNIVNQYWLTVADAYTYASRDKINEVATTVFIKRRKSSQRDPPAMFVA